LFQDYEAFSKIARVFAGIFKETEAIVFHRSFFNASEAFSKLLPQRLFDPSPPLYPGVDPWGWVITPPPRKQKKKKVQKLQHLRV
jgi:hypothetical protein